MTLLWIVFALLAVGTVYAVVRPMLAQEQGALTSEAADHAVYRDQLAEVEADLERGLIDHEQAEAARTEIGRRLLDTDKTVPMHPESEGRAGGKTGARAWRGLAGSVAALVPLASLMVYLALGSPRLPDQPHAERVSKDLNQASVMDLISRVEERLRTHPEDGQAWQVLAPIYVQLGRFDDAAEAYQNSIERLGETPDRLVRYIEARMAADNGVITETSMAAIQRLGETSPERPEVKFWLALSKEQDGRLEEAAEGYRLLLEEGKPEDQWREMVETRLEEVEKKVNP